MPAPEPDHGPNTPPVDAADVDVAFLDVHAYSGGRNGPEAALQFDLVVTGLQANGDVATFVDQTTGATLSGPQILPFRQTPYRYNNAMTPGVMITEFAMDFLAVPYGTVLTCTVTRGDGQEVDENSVVQADEGGLRDLTLMCVHARRG